MTQKAFKQLVTVFGGQMGSEGKGGICRYLTGKLLENIPDNEPILAYRIGGPNAGHTQYLDHFPTDESSKVVTMQIPGPMFLSPRVIGIIGPEGVVDLHVLENEVEQLFNYSLDDEQRVLYIDQSAVIISNGHKQAESGLIEQIGSTGKGVGQATAAKVLRGKDTSIAKDNYELRVLAKRFVRHVRIEVVDTIQWLKDKVKQRERPFEAGVIEGTQGAQLSLHTSGFWPYATSRECTPQGIWAGCGLHPEMAIRHTSVMVVRTYPIRVAGNSGPLPNETTWEALSELIGRDVTEVTTVTKKTRRVAELDPFSLERTIFYTRPDVLAVTFLDYVSPEIHKQDPHKSSGAMVYLQLLSDRLGVPITLVGTGAGYVYSV